MHKVICAIKQADADVGSNSTAGKSSAAWSVAWSNFSAWSHKRSLFDIQSRSWTNFCSKSSYSPCKLPWPWGRIKSKNSVYAWSRSIEKFNFRGLFQFCCFVGCVIIFVVCMGFLMFKLTKELLELLW